MLNEDNRIKTGIAGLDEILLDGIPRANVTVVQGSTGSGKTLLGMGFIYHGITRYNEPGIIIVFETSPGKMIRDAATLGWNLEELQEQKKLQIVFTSPEVLAQELRAPDSLLLETAREIGARRIFIDGITLLKRALASGRSSASLNEVYSFRELLQQLLETFIREDLTVMISLESGSSPQSFNDVEEIDYLADTVIQLTRTDKNRCLYRNLAIVKSRGQNFESGQHTLEITEGKGLEVFRRVQAPGRKVAQPTSTAKRSVTGVEAIDTLIGGGIFDGSTTLVLGVSGVGKTVLGTHLLREGAAQQGTRGLLVSLDEHPAQIIRNAATLGLDLQGLIDSGKLNILFENPQELNIDRHFAQITRLVEEQDVQRLVIDGLTSYSTALGDQSVYRDFFHALVGFTKGRLMSTFLNYENPEFLGFSTFMPDFPVSSIVDNIILLSLVEMESSLHRCMTVVKARGSHHEFDSREYRIGEGGIILQPAGQSVRITRPFSSYSSILSRAPTRLPIVDKGDGLATSSGRTS